MAEIAVNLVINKLMLLLKDGVYLVRDVRIQLMLVKDQLRLIQAYLRDADAKAEMEKTSNLMKEWVAQIREVSYCIEDVFDEYLLQVENKHCEDADNKNAQGGTFIEGFDRGFMRMRAIKMHSRKLMKWTVTIW
ncbi:Virus X resistance protein-like, coiled-coil domain [Sesbania bispinosa]|nr:Virus X resistance protein-like, coiled-coil domain [Sesbania bispinosa]